MSPLDTNPQFPAVVDERQYTPTLGIYSFMQPAVSSDGNVAGHAGLGMKVDFFIFPEFLGGHFQFGQSVEMGFGDTSGERSRNVFVSHFSDFVFPLSDAPGKTGIGIDVPVGSTLYFPDQEKYNVAEFASVASVLVYIDPARLSHWRFECGPGLAMRNDSFNESFPIDNSDVAPVELNLSLRVGWNK